VGVGWWWENRAEGKVGGGGKSEGKRHPPEAGAKDRSQGKIKGQRVGQEKHISRK